jgi:hypothetical protein
VIKITETMRSLLQSLCRSNQGLLAQKLGLMDAVVAKHGQTKAEDMYHQVCPIVQATVGQHIRHSVDHIERAILAAKDPEIRKIRYDVRKRGGEDEHNLDAARARVEHVRDILDRMANSNAHLPVMSHNIEACFMLSGTSPIEFALPSTAARELGFAAHHGIHHMAMVKIIALQTLGLDSNDLPADFGKAPSTSNFDRQQQRAQSS